MNKIQLTILAILTFTSVKSMACSCAPNYDNGLEETAKNAILSAEQADVVVVAKAVQVEENSPRKGMFIQEATFSLVSNIKGELGRQFTIYDNDVSGGMCGYSFEQNETYLLYMTKRWNGKLYTNSCTRTKRKPANGDDYEKERWATEIKALQ